MSAWEQEPLTHPHSRPLNYRGGAPREKGIDVKLAVDFVAAAMRDEYDVGIVMSGDTDLLPALELVAKMRGDDAIEVAAWQPDVDPGRRLNLDGLWCHWLDRSDFGHVRDDMDYSLRTRRR